MNNQFPLDNVKISRVAAVREVVKPLFATTDRQVNRDEFAMQVKGVGCFYACNGNEVEFSADQGADAGWVQLMLNSQVLVALLHQRKMINFHASSFIYNQKGIMILGETGAGKSSLTASFTLDGAGFLSDDLTPVIFKEAKPYIRSLYRNIKLWGDTIGQLNIGPEMLTEAEAGTGKQYLQVNHAGVEDFPLHTIFKIEIGENNTTEFYTPGPAEKFSLLRSEICSSEILAGMPETETEYLRQLLQIVQQVNTVRVVRPATIEIAVLHKTVSDYLCR